TARGGGSGLRTRLAEGVARLRAARAGRSPENSTSEAHAPLAAGGDEDRPGGAGGGGCRDATDVRDAAAGDDRAHGVALARLLERGEDVGQQPRRGLEDLGAQRVQRPQELAVLHELGLAAQATIDVTAGGTLEHA